MTIGTTTVKHTYNGDGSTTSFPINFIFWDNADLTVILRDSLGVELTWVEGTHYTITGGSGSTGTLTVETTPTDYTPASGETLVIISDRTELQGTELPLGGNLPSATVEQMIDICTRLIQQHSDQLVRTAKLPQSSSLTPSLPEPGANELIKWNAAGTDLESAAVASISTAIDTLISSAADDDLLAYDSTGSQWVNLSVLNNLITLALEVRSTDAGAAAGPTLDLHRNSASPAAADVLGNITFSGEDSGSNKTTYAEIDTLLDDPVDASEDGTLRLKTAVGATLANRLLIANGIYTPSATGGDQGADTINAVDLYGTTVRAATSFLHGGLELGHWYYIGEYTATSAAQLDVEDTNIFGGAWDKVLFEIHRWSVATDDVELRLRVGTGAGPTYQTGGYDWSQTRHVATATVGGNQATSSGYVPFSADTAAATDAVGNAAEEYASGRVILLEPDSASISKFMEMQAVYLTSNGTIARTSGAGIYSGATNALTGFRFYPESGNMTITVKAWGLRT